MKRAYLGALLTLLPRHFRDRHRGEMYDLWDEILHPKNVPATRTRGLEIFNFTVDVVREAGRQRWIAWRSLRLVPQVSRIILNRTRHLRAAFRGLRTNVAFTVGTVATMAFGIGAPLAVFTMVRAVLVEPLPYSTPDHLVRLHGVFPIEGLETLPLSWDQYVATRKRPDIFESVGAYNPGLGWSVTVGNRAEVVAVAGATHTLLPTLGVTPAFGRNFTPFEDTAEGPGAVLISHDLWQRGFREDPAAVGEMLHTDNGPYRIVGVLPRGFVLPNAIGGIVSADVLTPIGWNLVYGGGPSGQNTEVVARLTSGVSVDDASAAAARAVALVHAGDGDRARYTGSARPLRAEILGETDQALLLLTGASGLVVLVALTSTVALFGASGLGRRVSLATRLILGATRPSILTQLATEGLLLGALGALGAVGVASSGIALLQRGDLLAIPRGEHIVLGGTTTVVAIAFCLVAVPLLAVVTGARVIRSVGLDTLREAVPASVERYSVGGLRLVVALTAVCTTLTVGALVMIRSLYYIGRIDSGFSTDGMVSADIRARRTVYRDAGASADFYTEVAAAVRQEEAIIAAGLLGQLPIGSGDVTFEFDGHTERTVPNANRNVTNSDYFGAAGIQLVEGRLFARPGPELRTAEVVVNETMARRWWPDGAIGEEIEFSGLRWRIVGVVKDTRNMGLGREPRPEMYQDLLQAAELGLTIFGMKLIMRTELPMGQVDEVVRSALARVDAQAPLGEIRPIGALLSRTIGRERLVGVLVPLFSAIALSAMCLGLTAVLGIYALRRRAEIGVRLAFGAGRAQVAATIIREGLRSTGYGLALGIAGAIAGTHALSRFVIGVTPQNLWAFVAAVVIVAVAATSAMAVPGLRAALNSPSDTLRLGQ